MSEEGSDGGRAPAGQERRSGAGAGSAGWLLAVVGGADWELAERYHTWSAEQVPALG